MNEDQKESGHKWHKQTFVQWFFVVLVLCIIAAVIAMGVGGQYGPFYSPNCNYEVEEVEYSAYAYYVDHNESLPILNGNYSNANCSSCKIINMSAILAEKGGMLRTVPQDTWQGPGADDDNCDSQDGNITGCSAINNYIWIVDSNGSVYSYCKGADCKTNNSGYQGLGHWLTCN